MVIIFWTTEQKYYTQSPKCHWTEHAHKASSFKSMETARNFAKSGLQNQFDALEYMEINKPEKPAVDVPILTNEEAEEKYAELRKAAEAFGKAMEALPALSSYYYDLLSRADKLQEDLLHKIEFDESEEDVSRMGRLLKRCRMKRRECKDIIAYLNCIADAASTDVYLAHQNSEMLQRTRTYKPRIAPQLFEQKGNDNDELN